MQPEPVSPPGYSKEGGWKMWSWFSDILGYGRTYFLLLIFNISHCLYLHDDFFPNQNIFRTYFPYSKHIFIKNLHNINFNTKQILHP